MWQIIFSFQKSSLAQVSRNKKKLRNVLSRKNSVASVPICFISSKTVGLAGRCVDIKCMFPCSLHLLFKIFFASINISDIRVRYPCSRIFTYWQTASGTWRTNRSIFVTFRWKVPRKFHSRYCHKFMGHIVTYRPTARQRLGKQIPPRANAANNRTSIARQRSGKHTSTVEVVFTASSVRSVRQDRRVVESSFEKPACWDRSLGAEDLNWAESSNWQL
jgi:hypothetical protein